MIVEMARVRVLGPQRSLGDTIRALQDLGVVHLIDTAPIDPAGSALPPPGRPADPASPTGALRHRALDPIARRRRHHLERVLADVERALDGLSRLGASDGAPRPSSGPPLAPARMARFAAQLAAEVGALRSREQALISERDALRGYEPLFADLDDLVLAGATRQVSIFLLRLRSAPALDALRIQLARVLGEAHVLRAHALASGETVMLLLVPAARAQDIEACLAEARVERAALPPALADAPLVEALPRMRPRLAEVARLLVEVHRDAAALAGRHGDALARARCACHDALLVVDAEAHAATSPRAFVLDGWLPADTVPELVRVCLSRIGPAIAVELIARAQWLGEDAPVVLRNPPLFAPFEALAQLMPLPRYGSVDPTPFVAVFFPMLFGVVVGDVGYGLAIAALALAIRIARPRARDLSRVGVAIAIYTVVFGALYGELFGDLGARWFGMTALWFDRKEAVLGFLSLAIALGLAHLVLGLVIAAVNRWRRDRREALGRGLTAVMLVLSAVALLALFERVPAVLLAPAVIAIIAALPVVVVLEGATALLDLMTILGHVLSYARVMALGTASVMLAIVANQMHGAFGSAAIGIAFALVFHLVNFAIALFSPTLHVMRLHYVEFFATFFEPGGGPYRPLRHWSPGAAS